MPRSRPYKTGLNERLKNPEYAAAYLNAVMDEPREVFLLALRDVAEAHKFSRVAAAAGVNRETLYRTLSARGNPTLGTYRSVLKALGVAEIFQAQPRSRVSRR
jgi:probable addiction module antidote protein